MFSRVWASAGFEQWRVTLISIKGVLKDEQGLSMGELLAVNFRQPRHEFNFGVGINLISYPLILPHWYNKFTLACRFWSLLFIRTLALNTRLLDKVHKAPHQKIMKPSTIQDMKWTWLQVAQAPSCEGRKLRGPRQKMLKLAKQWALSKPRRNWHQGPTCRRVKVPEDMRSITDEGGRKSGWGGPRPVGPRQPSHPTSSFATEEQGREGHHFREERVEIVD
jgi:hypothetical protein